MEYLLQLRTSCQVSDKKTLSKYLGLRQPKGTCQCMYIWIDNNMGTRMRSKSKTFDFIPKTVQDIPGWYFDGSSAYEAEGDDNEADLFIKPISMFKDPIRADHNKIVLCEALDYKNLKDGSISRRNCSEALANVSDHCPLFTLTQEYTLLDLDKHPYGWPKNSCPDKEGPYYCGVGFNAVHGRDIAEAHYRACQYAGIKITSLNSQIMPSQWEYKIGVCDGVSAGDDVWIARYLLHRVAEDFGVIANFDSKLTNEIWNSPKFCISFSTKAMRDDNGIVKIEEAVQKLSLNHEVHMKSIKTEHDNSTETEALIKGDISSAQCSNDVAKHEFSIQIPQKVLKEKKGYLMQKHLPANCDPYLAIENLIKTVFLNQCTTEEI